MEIGEIIAGNLKKLRTERALSLGQLAELSGVSKVMLSQIEKAETNPTVNTIWKIAKGLKVPYTRLIDKPKDDTVVVRGETCPRLNTDEAFHRVACHFAATPTRNFELFQAALDAGGVHESIGHTERSQEYILVTSGELTLAVGGKQYVLAAGDSICFDAAAGHTYINNGDETSSYIIINFYP